MNLSDIIEIKEKEIITVVGAGGKTSFINYFINYYKNKFNILHTTTTKIYTPYKNHYENILMLNEVEDISKYDLYGRTVCGKFINKDDKIVGLDFSDIDKIIHKFDIVFIEGDGSKRKKLKGWSKNEPVVYPRTTKTIGILDITSYNMDINENNIHRLKEYEKITNVSKGKVSIENLKDVALNENGLFKNSQGEKILFINKVENHQDEIIALKLISSINKEVHNIRIFYGSIRGNTLFGEKV